MALKPTLALTQKQRITLTPELRQSLTLLRLPLLDLIEHIRAEAIDNPLLQVSEPSANRHADSAYDIALNSIADTITLGESIRHQLAALPIPRNVKDIAIYLTGDLSENGFLETNIPDAIIELNTTADDLEAAIEAIQSCEPTGVGARDITECLLLQLIEKGVQPATAQDVLKHVQLLVDGQWALLSNLLSLSEDRLIQIAELIRTLKPIPVAGPEATERPMVPDVSVEDTEKHGLSVTLSNLYLPELSLDTSLLSQARADPATARYIESHHMRARNLMHAVKYRGETLLRITREIVIHQHRFFIDGPDHLAPLTRTTIANKLSLHASTVGRAIADKNLDFNGTLYPLSFFLSSALKKGAFEHISAYSVQQAIYKLIKQEPARFPLSDSAIVKELRADGVDIARRTVAKYRGCMNIPSSFVRRKIAAAQQMPQNSPGSKKNMDK